MSFRRFALASVAAVSFAVPALADDSGYFVTRLGRDTTGFEHYTRTATGIEVDQVGRSPRVLWRRFTYAYKNGALTSFDLTVTPPDGSKPTQTVHAVVDGDSLRTTIQSGSAPVQNTSIALPAGTLVAAFSSPWALYEGPIAKLLGGKADSLSTPLFFIGASSVNRLTVSRLGRDSVALVTDRGDVFHARIDKSGRVLGVLPVAGTAKFSIERVEKLDLDALAAAYAARDQAGAALGALSPRDTVEASVAGAALWIDYGRPAKRGRAIFGGIVPYGELWRTGANAATQFKTDKALDFGGTVVPPGFYTLWTLPRPDGWKLVVNGETGQWGTAHNAEKDLYTIDMKASALPEPIERFTIAIEPAGQGGEIHFDWDTARATAAFTVP